MDGNNMAKIIKTTIGSADFVLLEEFEDEGKAIEGKDHLNSDCTIDELKIKTTKYKLKDGIPDG
jgi:hypothetical protein